MDERFGVLVDWVKEQAKQANGLMVPLSGGSDSFLAHAICAKAFPDKTIGIHIGTSLRCAAAFEGNGQVRMIADRANVESKEAWRWSELASISQKENRWLVGAQNRSERVFGTYSLASRIAAFLPIGGLWKSEVMEICRAVGAPEEILQSSRKADPECGRPVAMAEIPLEVIDEFLREKAGEAIVNDSNRPSAEQLVYLETIYLHNRFKITLPLVGPSVVIKV